MSSNLELQDILLGISKLSVDLECHNQEGVELSLESAVFVCSALDTYISRAGYNRRRFATISGGLW